MKHRREYRVRYADGQQTNLLTRREAEGLFSSFITGKRRSVQIVKEKEVKRRD